MDYSSLYYYNLELGYYESTELPTNYFDLMPFTDNGMKYYTGLFTSRPNLKKDIRQS